MLKKVATMTATEYGKLNKDANRVYWDRKLGYMNHRVKRHEKVVKT